MAPALKRNQKDTPAPAAKRPGGLRRAANKAKMLAADSASTKPYSYPVKPPELPAGVVPAGITAPVMSMDANPYSFAAQAFQGGGFPGFSYLSQLATRAEYRAFAATMSTELTREWLEFTSQQDDDSNSADKIKAIEEEFKRLNVRGAIQKAAENDCYFGRAQIFLEIAGADRKTPLILDPRTIAKGSLARVVPVEAIWTTPCAYNALDPAAPDFYRPSSWFMLGQEVHASRLMTVVTRPLPDILKPAFNFAGMSLSQLAEPYVDNWLRTRQSVADLINNFSITALATSMDQVLQGDDDGADVFARAELFTATRSNRGLMLLDKEREEIVQVNTPLSGLHELQAQSQEHMCSVSRMPAIVLTGISPSGLNASSDGEIRIFYDWIAAQQEAYWREPLEVILKAVQLSLFGEIDPDIGLAFIPLYQMTPAEESEIRAKDGVTDCAYVAAGIIDPSEVRDRLAKDPNSGYMGLDAEMVIVPPAQPVEGEEDPGKAQPVEPAQDAEFEENKHPRADNGQFGSGGGSGEKSSTEGLTAERGRFDWEVKNEAGEVVGKYPTSLSRKAALEKHAEVMAEQAAKKSKSKESAKANKEKREKDNATLDALNTAFNENRDLIEHAHMNANLSFKPMSAEEFAAKATVPIYQSRSYGGKKGSEYRLVMVDGKPAYARESDHWGDFSTSDYVNGEQVSTEHKWELPGAKTGWGNKERSAGYVLLEDLPK